MAKPTAFPVLLQTRVPEAVAAAVDSAATKHCMKRSELIRSAVVDKLAGMGVSITPPRRAEKRAAS